MKTVILSAGQGRRLLPYTKDRPKCLVPVAGRPILAWQLESLRRAGIKEAVVVTGFGAATVDDFLALHTPDGLTVRTSFNPFFALADNLGSLFTARHELRGGAIILNGDTLFEPPVMIRLLEQARLPVTVTINRKARYDDDDMKVHLDGDRLAAVGKTLPADVTDGESIGMIRLDAEGARAVDEAMEFILRQSDGTRKWYLSAIDRVAKQRKPDVGTVSIEGLAWGEIDCPADLHEMTADSPLFNWSKQPAHYESTTAVEGTGTL